MNSAVGAIAYAIANDTTASKQVPPAASPTLARAQRAPKYAPPPAPAPQRLAFGSEQVLLNLASQIPSVSVTDLARAPASARGVCAGLQNGESPKDAAASTENTTGLTPAQAAAGVNAAISAYCPQYLLSSCCERGHEFSAGSAEGNSSVQNGRRGSLTRQPHVWHRSQSKARQVTALAERKPLPCSPASPPTPAPWLAPSWC